MPKNKPVFTRLHLIRHGQTDWNKQHRIQGNRDDIPLNSTGLDQAGKVANNLRQNYQVDIIYSSQTKRAQQTAEKISTLFNAKMHFSANLNEVDFGDFSGSNINEIEAGFPDYFKAFHHFISTNREMGTKRPDIPNGESIDHIEKRIKVFIAKILSEHSGKQIAAVSHGSFIKCMITYFSGESIQNYMPYWVENASISIVDFYGSIPVIRKLNDTSHLDKSFMEFAVPRII